MGFIDDFIDDFFDAIDAFVDSVESAFDEVLAWVRGVRDLAERIMRFVRNAIDVVRRRGWSRGFLIITADAVKLFHPTTLQREARRLAPNGAVRDISAQQLVDLVALEATPDATVPLSLSGSERQSVSSEVLSLELGQ